MLILQQVLYYDGLGDWREVNEAGTRHQAVTAADIQRVVRTYFTKENRNVAIYTRKGGKSPADATESPALTQEEQAALRAFAAKVKEAKDAQKLTEALRALEAHAAQANPKQQNLLQSQRKLLQQRIEELK
jgi:hypothetical protein